MDDVGRGDAQGSSGDSPTDSPTPAAKLTEAETPENAGQNPVAEPNSPAVTIRLVVPVLLEGPPGPSRSGLVLSPRHWLAVFGGTPVGNPSILLRWEDQEFWLGSEVSDGCVVADITKDVVDHAAEPERLLSFVSAAPGDPTLPIIELGGYLDQTTADVWGGIIGCPLKIASISPVKDWRGHAVEVRTAPVTLSLAKHSGQGMFVARFGLQWEGRDLGKASLRQSGWRHGFLRVDGATAGDLGFELQDGDYADLESDGCWYVLMSGPRTEESGALHAGMCPELDVSFYAAPTVTLKPRSVCGALVDYGDNEYPCHIIKVRTRGHAGIRLPTGELPEMTVAATSGTGEKSPTVKLDRLPCDAWAECVLPATRGQTLVRITFGYATVGSEFLDDIEENEYLVEHMGGEALTREIECVPLWSGFHRITTEALPARNRSWEDSSFVDVTLPGEQPPVNPAFLPVPNPSALPAFPACPDLSAILDGDEDDEDLEKRQWREWQDYGPLLAKAWGVGKGVCGRLVDWGDPTGGPPPIRFIRERPDTGQGIPTSAAHSVYLAVPTPEGAKRTLFMSRSDRLIAEPIERIPIGQSRDEETLQVSPRSWPPSPSLVAATVLPESTPLGGAWVLMTSDSGFAIFWLDHSKPVDTVVKFRPWSELGWHWMEK